jgi:hypothetical protein
MNLVQLIFVGLLGAAIISALAWMGASAGSAFKKDDEDKIKWVDVIYYIFSLVVMGGLLAGMLVFMNKTRDGVAAKYAECSRDLGNLQKRSSAISSLASME